MAICDQIEDPKQAKGIVKRAVTRILTPGMVYDSDTLEQTQSHYLASFAANELSFVDSSTGEAFYFTELDLKEQQRLLETLPVAELVIGEELPFASRVIASRHSGLAEIKDLPISARRLISYIQSLAGDQALQT